MKELNKRIEEQQQAYRLMEPYMNDLEKKNALSFLEGMIEAKSILLDSEDTK